MLFIFIMLMLLNSSKAPAQLHLKQTVDSLDEKISFRLLPQNFYTNYLGYFCKKEVQLQKLFSLPVYFRLGSKEYVDWMEKKPNALKRF